MTSFISHTTIDCTDAYRMSTWWQGVLGYVEDAEDPNEPGHQECPIFDAETGHTLLFIEVPDPTPGKNRFHLDLRPRDQTQQEEVDRLLAHGATLSQDHRDLYGPGSGWVTLADPEGNLFCVLKSQAERAALAPVDS